LFGKLPEIFGRDFVVAYFLPAGVFVAVSTKLIGLPLPLRLSLTEAVQSAALFALAAWLGGVILMAVNPVLIRMLAGYGRFNPARLFKWIEVLRFKKLLRKVSELDAQRDACKAAGEEMPAELQNQRIKLYRRAAERFPDQISALLPTGFGNTIRAFEIYPRLVYGVDAIFGWNRLLAVIPEDYRAQIDAAKAQMDLCVNLMFLSAATAVGYVVGWLERPTISRWIFVAAMASSIVFYLMACNAARLWGDLIKASFDVFLPELRKRLELRFPSDKAAEHALWTGFSQSITYRRGDTLPERVEQPRTKP
jgi:hypothetical protein